MDRVQMVGFDMDYTLAIYVQGEMDRLSIEVTAKKLVERGYPEELLSMRVLPEFPIRGLLVDRKLGNVLKMDRYRYVKRAYHGTRELSREERRVYHTKRLRPGTARYHWVDTLYALSEVAVYAGAIDILERQKREVDYDQLFADVRACIDVAHQDGSILDVVLADLPRFVERDPMLGPTLHKLRSAGKDLFLLTNSRAAYTDKMMTYLLDGALPEYPSWRGYFDLIITASRKPTFFQGDAQFLEVLADGTTRPTSALEKGRVYQGGNIVDFERLAGVAGDHVLYVGDHIYGDVLRAKKETAWRTAMVIQELDGELAGLGASRADEAALVTLEDDLSALEDELREQQLDHKRIQRALEAIVGVSPPPELEAERVRKKHAIDKLKQRLRALEAEADALELKIENAFHPYWGPLFRVGPEVSSFGDQVEEFACLYTDRVSRLYRYSAGHYFRSPRDRMPHELGRGNGSGKAT